MIVHGTIECSQCGAEFNVSGELENEITADGSLVSYLAPDIASTAIMQAHSCGPTT